MRTPDFFIIGAPKCGTSAICRYLQTHPGIFMPEKKEPHYFSFDLPGRRDITDEQDYWKLFEDARPSALIGEGSATYLFSEVALRAIIDRNPAARMIALLRNPVDASHAYHSERLYNLSEYIDSFEEAWRLQEQRVHGQFISRHCRDAKLLQYRKVFSYSSQIRRFFDLAPATQRLVLIFEEFRKEPRETYTRILEFLGLPDDGRQDFPAIRANRTLRNRRLAEWRRSMKFGSTRWYQNLQAAARSLGLQPKKLMHRLNTRQRSRTPLDPHFRRQLAVEFEPDVRALERLIGRRLDCWSDFLPDQTAPLTNASHSHAASTLK